MKKTITKTTEREKRLLELVDALDEYIGVLGRELNDCATIATIHGWSSFRAHLGCKMRRKIKGLRKAAAVKP